MSVSIISSVALLRSGEVLPLLPRCAVALYIFILFRGDSALVYEPRKVALLRSFINNDKRNKGQVFASVLWGATTAVKL